MTVLAFVAFNLFVLALLALDLGVFHRRTHVPTIREALTWTAVWVTLALGFGAGLFLVRGGDQGLEYLTGYLIEYSLSLDNIFVMVLIFGFFAVPARYQHRVLFWGVLGALALRGAMIGAGTALIERFGWILYLFGAFLVFSGVRMVVRREETVQLEHNPVVRLVRRVMPVTTTFDGARFFTRHAGVLAATPLFLALVVVETTDLIFALDSIPAIFAVTRDPFIVYTSNVFAILGLRSLYFVLRGAVDTFHYLQPALAAVLVFVGGKMLLADLVHLPGIASLGVIAGILGVGIGASLVRARRLAQAERAASARGRADRAGDRDRVTPSVPLAD